MSEMNDWPTRPTRERGTGITFRWEMRLNSLLSLPPLIFLSVHNYQMEKDAKRSLEGSEEDSAAYAEEEKLLALTHSEAPRYVLVSPLLLQNYSQYFGYFGRFKAAIRFVVLIYQRVSSLFFLSSLTVRLPFFSLSLPFLLNHT